LNMIIYFIQMQKKSYSKTRVNELNSMNSKSFKSEKILKYLIFVKIALLYRVISLNNFIVPLYKLN